MGRVRDLLQMVGEGRLGFLIDEQMSGQHRFTRDFPPAGAALGQEAPLSFAVTWGHPRLERFLNPLGGDFLFAVMRGTVDAGGLAARAPLKGALELRYFQDATVRYTFEFDALGRPFRYVGEKRGIRPWNLHRTHTECYGTLTDLTTAEVISESLVRFDLKRLPCFLASLRPG